MKIMRPMGAIENLWWTIVGLFGAYSLLRLTIEAVKDLLNHL